MYGCIEHRKLYITIEQLIKHIRERHPEEYKRLLEYFEYQEE